MQHPQALPVLFCLAAALAQAAPAPSAAPAGAASAHGAAVSGIEIRYIDDTVRAQDDFFRHVNGRWLATTPIPADKSGYGTHDQLLDAVQDQLRGIVEGLQATADPADPDQRKIADLYASFMDEAAVEAAGLQALAAANARIDALAEPRQLPVLIAALDRLHVNVPIGGSVHQDAHDSTRYVFDIGQGGLGMPDRDYYLVDDARFRALRMQYVHHVERMLGLAGEAQAAAHAAQIVALETRLAQLQWTKVDNRDPVKTYNPYEPARLGELAPGVAWQDYLAAAGVAGKVGYVVVSQPSYVTGWGRLAAETPLAVWQAYLHWHLLSDYSPYLGKALVDEHFAFYGTALRGIEQNRARWKRGIGTVEECMGEALGRLYVSRHFPPAAKARMDQLVANLLAAYRADIDRLDWMGPETRRKAHEKLDKLTVKIGYPAAWRDYGALQIRPGDLVGNVMRARQFEYDRNIGKLGKPIDRGEWFMTPQTVNAYSEFERNEIVFPAAYLQPPFFNVAAEDAVNYGAIGTTIGHEISHLFDDKGSQYDGDGNLLPAPGWFTAQDLENFKQRTRALVAQYAAYVPVPGYPVNGELTLGENIADNSGMTVAFQAYERSLGGKRSPVIDGLSGEQRFFMGWAQKWRGKTRESEAIRRIKTDPHAPREVRGNAPERNLAPFYEAFGVKEGDRMYLPPAQRVTLW
jgi:predicted metalloendopeptidase